MKRDEKTKQFKAIPINQKTEKILQMEKKLGVSFEEDYKVRYLDNPKRSQREFAKRWETNRGVIWKGNPKNSSRSRTPSWIERVGLKDIQIETYTSKYKQDSCEICGENEVTIENAHWIPRTEKGNEKFYNIIKLCPNCHKKLDNKKDPIIIEKCRYTLFAKAMKKLVKEIETDEDKMRMVSIAKQILNSTR